MVTCQIGISIFKQNSDWVKIAVNSALDQEFDGLIECTIRVDGPDACSSSLASWLKAKEDSDSRVNVIFGDVRRGCFGSLKKVFNSSDSEFICQLDADDWLDKNVISNCIKELKLNPNAPFAYTQFLVKDEKTGLTSMGKLRDGEYNNIREIVDFSTFHCRVIRRVFYNLAGGYDSTLNYVGDYDLCLKLADLGKPIFVSVPGYYYRVHSKNTSYTSHSDLQDESYFVAKRALNRKNLDHNLILSRSVENPSIFKLDLNYGPILMAGMHKSGTSMISLIMNCFGLNIGENLLRADSDNPVGYGEDVEAISINRLALQLLNTDPDWPLLQNSYENCNTLLPASWVDRAKSYLDVRSSKTNYWGWKDPRNSILLNYWHNLSPSIRVLGVYRSFNDVMSSIRKSMYLDFAREPDYLLKMWIDYNSRILYLHNLYPQQVILVNSTSVKRDPFVLLSLLEKRWLWNISKSAPEIERDLERVVSPNLLKSKFSVDWNDIVPINLIKKAEHLFAKLEVLADINSFGVAN